MDWRKAGATPRPACGILAFVEHRLRRIEVDFNTLTSEPVGLVKLGSVEPVEGAARQPLREGARVILWEPGLEVEASLSYDAATNSWAACPDGATFRWNLIS